ncbi:MAG: hypothetical protein WCS73_11680 [Lentisphaeria bacterium]
MGNLGIGKKEEPMAGYPLNQIELNALRILNKHQQMVVSNKYKYFQEIKFLQYYGYVTICVMINNEFLFTITQKGIARAVSEFGGEVEKAKGELQ